MQGANAAAILWQLPASPPSCGSKLRARPDKAGSTLNGVISCLVCHDVQVINIKVSKTGKHGHAKCHFTAADIFDGSKHEDVIPGSHTAIVPFVTREEYQVIGTDDEGFLQLMAGDGEVKEDLGLPKYPEGMDDELKDAIESAESNDKTVYVTVTGAMGKEQISSFKTADAYRCRLAGGCCVVCFKYGFM